MNSDFSTAPRAVRIAIARALVDQLTGGARKRRAAGGVTAAIGGEYSGSRRGKGKEVAQARGSDAATTASRCGNTLIHQGAKTLFLGGRERWLGVTGHYAATCEGRR